MSETTPLIRLAKREDMPKKKIWMIRLGAFCAAILIGMINDIRGTVWEHNIVKITVSGKKNLVLEPRTGKEKFIFGEPVRVEEKLSLMKAYYESVVPVNPDYRTVDLRYRGQLVCRK